MRRERETGKKKIWKQKGKIPVTSGGERGNGDGRKREIVAREEEEKMRKKRTNEIEREKEWREEKREGV